MNQMKFVAISPLNILNQPHPRSGHRAVATESDLWIWGGYHPATTADPEPRMFQQLWRFNFARRQWTHEQTTGNGPTITLASHAMCLDRQFLFVFGGTGYPFGESISNELFVLNLKNLQWKQCVLHGDQPRPVYGASMIIQDDHLYVLCGTNRWTYNTDVYDIHLSTMICRQIGQTFGEMEELDSNGRYRQEAHLHDDKIYLFGGGGHLGVSFSLENIPMFDLLSRRWSFVHTNPDPVHNFPHARKFHSIFPFRDNQVLMFGGAYFDLMGNGHALVDEHIWSFDFDRYEWSMLQSIKMVRPLYFHAAAMNSSGEIWTHGGVISEYDATGNPKRITTLYKMHTRPLNLGEITWKLLLDYLADPERFILQSNVLAKLHIPARYAQRLC